MEQATNSKVKDDCKLRAIFACLQADIAGGAKVLRIKMNCVRRLPSPAVKKPSYHSAICF
jgi:hypothetical protein